VCEDPDGRQDLCGGSKREGKLARGSRAMVSRPGIRRERRRAKEPGIKRTTRRRED
jgi:hypothetical protein